MLGSKIVLLLGACTAAHAPRPDPPRPRHFLRAADGDEGGRHQLIKAGVADGKLYLLKVQCGDKRWFKGVNKEAIGAKDSFTIA